MMSPETGSLLTYLNDQPRHLAPDVERFWFRAVTRRRAG
jgi:hypothetical protein